MRLAAAALALPIALSAIPADAQELNLYSSRHYDTDRALYEGFTRQTGIRLRLIEGDADQLIERIRTEGANSPADVLITVDAARLARAQAAGLLQPVQSDVLQRRVPANLREPNGHWFGLSVRARVLMVDAEANPPINITRWEQLADPQYRGICVRSSSHPYNLSLVGSILAANGEPATEAWARGVVANFARQPQGGDTPQFQAIATGQCRIAISNTYYLARFAASDKPEDQALARRIRVIFPNSGDRGAHVNVSGAGVVRTAPNREAAVRFLEYMTSVEAQRYFAEGNFEYPVVADVQPHPALAAFGSFRPDQLNAATYAANAAQALQIMQRAGWR
jgi:iron(III) transport system substrate-binding protein